MLYNVKCAVRRVFISTVYEEGSIRTLERGAEMVAVVDASDRDQMFPPYGEYPSEGDPGEHDILRQA